MEPSSLSRAVDNKFVRLSIEKSLRDLPALPAIVMRVLQETQNQETSAHNVEKLLGSDQALASKVLRVVNSAYYGLSGQITSLSQAVMILGMPQVRNLVLSVSAISTMKPKTPRQQEMLKLFWLHAFGVAAATQLIAQHKRLPAGEAEELFLAGLLHDIGLLFLYCMFTQTYEQVVKYAGDRQIPMVEAEVKLLGLDHAKIGGIMASQWKLPPALTDRIERHEGPFVGGEDPAVYCVHVSDRLMRHVYHPEAKLDVPDIEPEALEWLAFSSEDLEELQDHLNRKLEEATLLFGLMAA